MDVFGWCVGCILRESESEKDWERVDESAKREFAA